MFRYINMPKLVAFYLKEFSVRADGTPSNLYKLIFCLCLPFVSNTFNRARMIALAIAECTQSRDQIIRLLKKITGADITFITNTEEFMCDYDGTNDEDVDLLPYGLATTKPPPPSTDVAIVPYSPVPNEGNMLVDLNGYSKAQFESYLALLIPFYTNYKINYTKDA